MIGCVVSYLKSLSGTPALPQEFVECNGQVLSDAQSVFNGVTIPNLNGASSGTKRFLRGAATSGTTGGTETHRHFIPGGYRASPGGNQEGMRVTNFSGTLPPYYEVVWVLQTKGNLDIIPVGCVVGFLKSLSGCPALPDEFVECNGQTLSDAQSVFNGVVIPNLNGSTQNFLRGSTTSGATGGTASHSHTIPVSAAGTCSDCGTGTICLYTNNSGTLPSYYQVVWTVRIK